MKLKHLLPIAALALPLSALAMPATTKPLTYTNPDGTKIELRLHGDEYFSFNSDLNCDEIYEKDAQGFWVKAVRQGRVMRMVNDDIELLRLEQDDIALATPQTSSMMRMAALNKDGRTSYPTIGNDIHALVILVQFPDRKFFSDDPQQLFTDLLNKRGFNEYNAKGCAAEYYSACSNGKFTPVFDVMPVVTMPKKAAYYAAADYSNVDEMIVSAVQAVYDSGVDLSLYDYDKNGVIDSVYVYYAGYGKADSGLEDTIWPHQADLTKYGHFFGNIKLGPYATSCERKAPVSDVPMLDGIGPFCHEYGHVLGLPDLYDAQAQNGGGGSNPTKTPGEWDVMDAGSYNSGSTRPPLFSGYEQWLCNWIEYEVAEPGDLTLNPLTGEDRNIYRINVTSGPTVMKNEYFIIESRSKEGWDTDLPDEGMLMWRISYNNYMWTNNAVNYNGKSRVLPMHIGNTRNAAFPGKSNRTFITNADVDLIDTYTTDWQLYITGIARDEETGVVTLNYNGVEPHSEIVEFTECYRSSGSSSLILQWHPIAGATDYEISIYREGTNGTRVYLNGNNAVMTGGRNWRQVFSIGKLDQSRRFTAEVRAYFDGIPSINVAKFEFTPEQLEVGSTTPSVGIDDVVADAQLAVTTGNGCIYAPEGAVVYNLQGLQTGCDNLPAGIYVVSYKGKTAKVVVR